MIDRIEESEGNRNDCSERISNELCETSADTPKWIITRELVQNNNLLL